MTVLMDTHAFLWFVNDDPQLSARAKSLIKSDSTVFLSIASVWEIAIKVRIGKLAIPKPLDTFISEQIRLNDFTLLPIRIADCDHVSTLPLHHGDPFDRLIIAQALVENIPISSKDGKFDPYNVQRVW